MRAACTLVNGRTPAEGQVFRNPDLAATLEKLAQGGRSAYYEGAIAKTVDAYFRRIGGDLRLADFAAYHGEWVEPRSVNYHGYDVFQLPPNSQGFGVLQMLQLLKPYDLRSMGPASLDYGRHRARSQAPRVRGHGSVLRRSALREDSDGHVAVG